MQNQLTCKEDVAFKSLGDESCKIKGGNQEMAAMMLIITLSFKYCTLAIIKLI